MAGPIFKTLINKIESLCSIELNEKQDLLQEINKIVTIWEEEQFMLKRLQKDKSIVINILNATINDLERSKKVVEVTNQELMIKQNALIRQKKLTEEKSKRLSENLRELERSYEELEQFSYIASHDLKSPLRTISNFAQLLQRRYRDQLDQSADEYINFIVTGTVQMHRIIRDLLAYAQVGHHGETAELVDLNEVLEAVKNTLKLDIEENKATIISKPLPTLFGVRTYLVQLFQNLIGNAIKFRSEKPPLIQIDFQSFNDDYWEFHISDNGIGLPASYQGKVFFPFQRVGDQQKKGTGIGLAVCKKNSRNSQRENFLSGNPGGRYLLYF